MYDNPDCCFVQCLIGIDSAYAFLVSDQAMDYRCSFYYYK